MRAQVAAALLALASTAAQAQSDDGRASQLLEDVRVAMETHEQPDAIHRQVVMKIDELQRDFPGSREARFAAIFRADAERLAREFAAAESVRTMGARWLYAPRKDPMSGLTRVAATLASDNFLNLDFPYAGPQHASISFFGRPSDANPFAVAIAIERGQIQCDDSCTIYVTFNARDSDPQAFHAREATDFSTDAIYLTDSAEFFRIFRTSNSVTVALPVYQHGIQRLYFTTAGLDESKLAR